MKAAIKVLEASLIELPIQAKETNITKEQQEELAKELAQGLYILEQIYEATIRAEAEWAKEEEADEANGNQAIKSAEAFLQSAFENTIKKDKA